METPRPSFSRNCAVLLLLQIITPSAEQFTVNALHKKILVHLGEVVELSCQLSPPQSAEHMEVRWFRNRYTQPVHLYKNGKDLYGETISRYVERTEFLKEAIGDGKVTLRILNISVDDDGQYHCFFQDGNFYDETIIELKVTATSLEVQVFVHPPTTKGVLVECNSGGWFPQPQMEWRDNRGEKIPHASISHSQDSEKLFNMKMTLLLTSSSNNNVTCYLQNPVTGQEGKTSIVLSDKVFPRNSMWRVTLCMTAIVLMTFIILPSVNTHCRNRDFYWCNKCPYIESVTILLSSVSIIAVIFSILHYKTRVPVSDPHFQLDSMWLEDITVILCVLMVFITMIISFIYFRLRDILQSQGTGHTTNSPSLDVDEETPAE